MIESTSLAALSALLSSAKTGVNFISDTYQLLRDVKKNLDGDQQLDEALIRLALLAVDQNLILLDGVNTRVEEPHQPALLDVFELLQLAPITALLIQWPTPSTEPTLNRTFTEEDFERWNAAWAQRAEHEQLLAQARYIAARIQGLRGLAKLPAAVRTELRLGLRIRNLKSAHLALLALLRSEVAVSHLIKRRIPSSPPDALKTSA